MLPVEKINQKPSPYWPYLDAQPAKNLSLKSFYVG
jgi:hypothetical protein